MLRRTAGAVYSRLIGRRRHDALMVQMAQLIQLVELLRLLHRILGVGLQLLMMRLMRGMSRLMMRRGEGGYRERDEQHRAAEDVRTTSTQCPRLLPTPFSCVFGFGYNCFTPSTVVFFCFYILFICFLISTCSLLRMYRYFYYIIFFLSSIYTADDDDDQSRSVAVALVVVVVVVVE